MSSDEGGTRRTFLLAATAAGAGLVVAGCEGLKAKGGEAKGGDDEEGEKVTPGEDLMQEHGVLKRILLIYGEGIRRIEGNEDLSPEAIGKAAKLVRSFVEEYHEQQEEQYVFPRLIKAGKEVETVNTLLEQHRAGRKVTDRIVQLASMRTLRDAGERRELAERMKQFIRMYNVHEAREDTVVFPAFRDLVSKREYEALGETFEDNEHKHFGADGFEMAVDQVAEIEKGLGIYDLKQFTPKI